MSSENLLRLYGCLNALSKHGRPGFICLSPVHVAVVHTERKLGGTVKVSLTLAPPSWVMRGHETLSFDEELKDTGVISWKKRKGLSSHGCVLKYLKAIFFFFLKK